MGTQTRATGRTRTFGAARGVQLSRGDKETLSAIARRHGAEFVAQEHEQRIGRRYCFRYPSIGDPHDRGIEIVVTRDVEESGVAPRLWPNGAPRIRPADT
jgi:hypothetical protein